MPRPADAVRRVIKAYDVRGTIPVLLPDEARAVDNDEHVTLVASPTARLTGPASKD